MKNKAENRTVLSPKYAFISKWGHIGDEKNIDKTKEIESELDELLANLHTGKCDYGIKDLYNACVEYIKTKR